MIIVHEIFVCKPGFASKLAKTFKEMMKFSPEMTHVMTDMIGDYNQVIMVSQFEDLAAYAKAWESYKNPSPEMKEAMSKMEDHTQMYLTGRREVYQVW
ncbi:MAG TPA: NIPSNAP family protein [Candidatus Binatia bacterium]|nr:NIPSNAP family protein [Candidatus Binatia bacterium]